MHSCMAVQKLSSQPCSHHDSSPDLCKRVLNGELRAADASCTPIKLSNVPQGCFDSAIERYEYGGTYRGVFPVKCNHDRELLAAVLHAGKPFGFGLEARSQGPSLLYAVKPGWL